MSNSTHSSRNRRHTWLILAAFLTGIALTGAGAATAAKMINGKTLINGTVTQKKLAKKVRAKLAKAGKPGAVGPQGAKGAKGATGARGPQGIPGPIGGEAGGVLSGTYPNPGLVPGAVTPTEISEIPAIRVKSSGTVSVNNNFSTPLPCDTLEYGSDPSMFVDGNPGELIAPRNGYYQVTAGARFNANATGDRGLIIYQGIVDAQTQVAQTQTPAVTTQFTATSITASALIRRAEGEKVSFRISQSSGGALNSGGLNTFCSMQWVGNYG